MTTDIRKLVELFDALKIEYGLEIFANIYTITLWNDKKNKFEFDFDSETGEYLKNFKPMES